MVDTSRRISGWKAIAHHYGRSPSTVKRWARDPAFPIVRVPGKTGGSVYAFASELDAYLAKQAADEPRAPGNLATERRRQTPWPVIILLAGLVVVGVGAIATLGYVQVHPAPIVAREAELPEDPALASLYSDARAQWATRTPEGLRRAVTELGAVTSGDPSFAPAYAGLADAYLLSAEYDHMPAALAYARGEAAAKAALAIDPDSADANRALGFVDYWWRSDVRGAREHFQRALRAEPANAQTHFWYGNVLMDLGDSAAGFHELRTARVLDPGSEAIEADYAWASWQHGSGDEGTAELQALEARDPSLLTPPYYLALIALSARDVNGYLSHAERWASLQGDPELIARLAAERAALRQGAPRDVLDLIASTPPTRQNVRQASIMSAGAAALAGRRARLLMLLEGAEAKGEHWSPMRWQQTLFAAWRGDREVKAHLNRLFAPSINAAPVPAST